MLNLRQFLLGLCLMGLNGLASAGDNVRQFSSELLLNESKQITQAEPFKYSDPVHGPALRKLLAPARAGVVVNEYLAGFPQGLFEEPDISRQFGPLANRYKKAFAARPKEFEEEYLDALTWMVLFMNAQRRFQGTVEQQISKSATPTPEEEAALSMMKGMQSLFDSLSGAMARDLILESGGTFSATGRNRVLTLASQLMSGSTDAPAAVEPVAEEPAKPAIAYAAMNADQRMLFGENIYQKNCLACHGATGAGISGTFPALVGSPKLAHADATIRIIVKGVPATVMPSYATVFDDDALAAVVNYIRAEFGGLKGHAVTPADIRTRRDMPAAGTPPGAVSDSKETPR